MKPAQFMPTDSPLVCGRRTALKSIMGGVAFAATASAPSLAVPAWAHRQKQALTTVVWNKRTKLLQVTHDIFAHDAEVVLAQLGRISTPDITGLRARANLALYTQEKFALKTLDGQDIPLSILGAETNTTYAHVYLEAKLSARPKGLVVTNTLLQDTFLDQINQVNVTLGSDVQTIAFVAGAPPKKVLA